MYKIMTSLENITMDIRRNIFAIPVYGPGKIKRISRDHRTEGGQSTDPAWFRPLPISGAVMRMSVSSSTAHLSTNMLRIETTICQRPVEQHCYAWFSVIFMTGWVATYLATPNSHDSITSASTRSLYFTLLVKNKCFKPTA